MARLPTGEDLMRRAKKLGVSDHELYDTNGIWSEPELQRRFNDAERAVSERRHWIVAVLSLAVAVIGVAAAWMALISNR